MGITSGLGKVGATVTKELAEKAFKSIPDFMSNIGKIGREVEISPQTMHGVQRHLEIQPPKNLAKEMKDVDQLFKGMVSEDPTIREASYGGMAGFDSNVRPINEAADGATRSQEAYSNHVLKKAPIEKVEPPPVHNIADLQQQKQWKKDTLGKWLLDNQDAIRSGELDATANNFGEIIYKNKRRRVSTESIKAFLDDPGNDVKLLKLKDASLEPATRDIQADVANASAAIDGPT